MHVAALAFMAAAVQRYPRPAGLTLEIGGRNDFAIRALFPPPYLAIDVRAGAGVDVVADGSVYRPDVAPVCVVCCEVFEHTPAADRICRNIATMLQPGGLVFITAAGPARAPHSAVVVGPIPADEYYANVEPATLVEWLSSFEILELEHNQRACDVYAVARKSAHLRIDCP
jgi:hypothetical protein